MICCVVEIQIVGASGEALWLVIWWINCLKTWL